MATLDLDFVRSQFPAFSEPSLAGWAFFENAGGSYTCRQVIDRLTDFYVKTKVQPYGPYPASITAGALMDESYRALAGYLNVGEDEVHFGPSTSQNTYVLANALRPLWADGDEIVVSNQDHEANAGVWRRLAERGIVVREWSINPDSGRLDIDDLDDLLTERTRLVAFPHASNVVADINPVSDITARARAAGAVTVVDGVSFAPHGLPDVAELGADVYLFSLYKTWGPHLGLMTIKRNLVDRLVNQGHFFNAADRGKRVTPAGPDHAQIAAAAGVVHYLEALHARHFGPAESDQGGPEPGAAERARQVAALIQRHEELLLAPLLAWLRDRHDVRLIGPDDPSRRAPTVSIVPRTKPVADVVDTLTEHKLMVGAGHFYAVRPLDGMGVDPDPGVLRLSFVHYTSPAEVEQLIAGLAVALG